MKRKVFSLMMLCLFAFLGLANAQVSPRDGGLAVNPDPVEMGYRPNGAWMRPFEAQLTTTGAAETVIAIETSNEDFFLIDGKFPTVVEANKPMKFTIDNNDAPAGPYSAELVVWSNTRKAYIFNVSATTYDPIAADVVETAPTVSSSFSATFGADIYDNYLLPGEEPDGKDVVYKLNVTDDVLFTANVIGENGKTALYATDFNGQPGPGAFNSIGGNGDAPAAPYEAQLGELGSATNSYFPLLLLYNYSIGENLFHADELAEAGMTTAPMASISWNAATVQNYEEKNITIWMANVTDEALTSTSHNTSGMTKVFTGNITPEAGWNEFVFNEGSFAWDGVSNLLVCIQRNNGAWHSSMGWRCVNTDFVSQFYQRNDGSAYDMESQTYSAYGTEKKRAVTLFKSVGSKGRTIASNMDGATLTPGEYYLVASSTSDEFTLNVNMETIPAPEPVSNPYPADGEMNIEMPLTLTWELGQYTTEYRVLLGTTWPPTNVVVDWTGNLAESLTVTDLYNNKNYFWRVDERNSSGELIGPIWGFTTAFNIPQNLIATSQKLYPGETAHLSWDPINDRSYRGYNVFKDDVQINTELITETTYDVTGLTYNMAGYKFNVNAHYDEGDSGMSNDLMIMVTGNGSVSGKVSELDGTTGISGVTVTFVGVDEFNAPATFTFTTGANGTFSGNLLAGDYTATAVVEGYNPMEYEGNIHIAYNTNTPGINFSLQEILYPLGEVIAEEIDENQVKVYWSMQVMSEIIEDFETGDFSSFDWQNDATYPWTITTTNPYEGQYCIKSGNYNVASSSSTIQVSVEISRDGLMSFYHLISSEASYDKGYFYIDGVEKMNTSGAGSWQQREYAITAGVHTFKWVYSKDSSVNSNQDCWYIDNISFVHDAAPAEAGWIGYDNETNEDAIGLTAGGSFYWGISFPTTTMAQYSGYTMTKVKMYDYGAHTGKVMIYKGGTSAPGTLVTEQNYTCTGSNNYVEINLSNPVAVDPSQSLWVIMNNFDGQYVASCCANSGDPNGRWVSMDGVEWMDMYADAGLDYSWQIQAYMSDGGKGVTLDRKAVASNAPLASPSVVSHGNIKDLQGDPNWTASANNRSFKHYNLYRTVCSDETGESAQFLGSLNDTLYLDNDWATLEPGIYKWGVSRYYEGNRNRGRVTYDFEDGTLQGWTNIDADGDGNVWENWNSDGTVAHSGTGVAASESYINYVGALTPDNWLVSPQMELPSNMTFWAAGQDPSYAQEHFGVYVSTSGTSTSNFTQVLPETVAGGTMTQYTVNLSSYAGQTGYVAIRHYNVTDMFRLNIDDITLGEGGGGGDDPTPPTPPTPPGGGAITYTDVYGESGVRWSNCLENRMYVSATVNVTTNSGDAVTGATVKLTNVSEPDLNMVYNATLDETGTYTWESIRRGTYDVNINLEGFTPIADQAEVGDATVLNYTLNEITAEVSNLYVSGTGWAIFGAMPTPPDGPQPPTPGEGQWYYYGGDECTNSIGASGAFYWAVMFPAGSYTGNLVTKVATYTTGYEAFSGTVTIFNDGTSAPANAVGTMDFNAPAGPEMYEMEFPTPVAIDPSKNLWVVMYNASSTTYVASACDDAGDPNARWVSLDGSSWMDLAGAGVPGYSWMLRAYVASGKGEVTEISYEPQPCRNTGLVASGHGSNRTFEYYNVKLDDVLVGTTTNPFFQHDVDNLVEGETYTTSVQKVYNTGESEWTSFDWVYSSCENYEGLQSAEGVRDGNEVVLNWVLPEGSGGGGDDPVDPTPGTVYDFEDGTLQGWTAVDADGDGYNWENSSGDGVVTHSGSCVAASESYVNYVGALTPDNWLISPQVTLPATMSFWACGQDPSWAAEHFGVFVSTSGTSTSNFTQVLPETVAGGTMTEYTVDLSAYAGQTGYVAIRHYNITDMFRLNVDDITLGNGGGGGDDPVDPTDGITANFEDGTLGDWTTIDADGDGYNWMAWSSTESPAGHNSSTYTATSASYQGGVLYPDNYLVSPAVNLGGTLHFYACAQDAAWPSEHFGVAISTTNNTSASAFTTIQEWDMSAKGHRVDGPRGDRNGRTQGSWYEYTVDLSAYSGVGYIAIRHFECSDWFRLNVDDITYSTSKVTRSRTTYDFEDGTLQGWTAVDADGDGYTWENSSGDGIVAHSGTGVAASESYVNYVGALTPNNWLISPQVTLPASMNFWACGQDPSWAAEHFGVFVSTSGTSTSNFTQVLPETVAGGTMTQYTVDLSAYAGQTGYVAIRHYNVTDMFRLNVDDITLGEGGDDPTPPTPPTPPADSNVIGVEIFRNGEWIAEVYAPTTTFTDVVDEPEVSYEIRVVYNGDVEDYSYYTMSCPELVIPTVFECIAPENLTGSYEWLTPDYFGALINWTYPGEVNADWYYYDNGTYATSVGAGGAFQWAAMYPAGTYEGNLVTKVSTLDYLSNASIMNGSVSIWEGGSNAPQTQLASMDIRFTGSQEELEFVFDEPVTVDPTKNLWVVFSNDDCTTGYPAAATSDVSGDPNGRWVGLGGDWADLAAAGLPGYTWYIHTYISDGLTFNVYRNGEVIATVPYAEGTITYFDQAPIGTYQYQVTAFSDACESDFALTPDGSQNYVEIPVTNVGEMGSETKLYPNPTNGYVKIEASGMTHLTVVNALGQVVYDADIHGDMYELNMGQYEAGIYMVRISTENGVSVKRVTLTK